MRFYLGQNGYIFISMSGQFLLTVYIIKPEMKLIADVLSLLSFWLFFARNSFLLLRFHVNTTRNEIRWKETSTHVFVSSKQGWMTFTTCRLSRTTLALKFQFISPAMKSNANISFMKGWNFILGRFHFGSHINSL